MTQIKTIAAPQAAEAPRWQRNTAVCVLTNPDAGGRHCSTKPACIARSFAIYRPLVPACCTARSAGPQRDRGLEILELPQRSLVDLVGAPGAALAGVESEGASDSGCEIHQKTEKRVRRALLFRVAFRPQKSQREANNNNLHHAPQ